MSNSSLAFLSLTLRWRLIFASRSERGTHLLPCHSGTSGLREERFVTAMGTAEPSFPLSLSFVSWGVEVGSCLGKKNEGDLFPLKYTLFSATAFASSVSILSFSFFCCSNNSSFWIACLSCNLETSAGKAAFFAEIFYLALTAELTVQELELAMDFDLFTFLGDPASTLLIETASSSSNLDCADCSHWSISPTVSETTRWTEAKYSLESRMSVSFTISAWYLLCVQLKSRNDYSSSSIFFLACCTLPVSFIKVSNSTRFFETTPSKPHREFFNRRIL